MGEEKDSECLARFLEVYRRVVMELAGLPLVDEAGTMRFIPNPFDMMGGEGLTHATKMAILNANYIAKRLEPHFPILYSGPAGLVAHECILDPRGLKAASGVEVGAMVAPESEPVIVCVASEMRGADAELYRRDKRVLSRRIERLLAAVDSAAACAHQLGADAVEQTLRDGVRAAIETPDEGDA